MYYCCEACEFKLYNFSFLVGGDGKRWWKLEKTGSGNIIGGGKLQTKQFDHWKSK